MKKITVPVGVHDSQDLLESIVLDEKMSLGSVDDVTAFSLDNLPCSHYFLTRWTPRKKALGLEGFFDIPVMRNRQQDVEMLLEATNRLLEKGRFTLCKQAGQPIFKQSIPSKRNSIGTLEELENALGGVSDAGAKMCEALELMSSGKSVSEAIFEAITPTMGEA